MKVLVVNSGPEIKNHYVNRDLIVPSKGQAVMADDEAAFLKSVYPWLVIEPIVASVKKEEKVEEKVEEKIEKPKKSSKKSSKKSK